MCCGILGMHRASGAALFAALFRVLILQYANGSMHVEIHTAPHLGHIFEGIARVSNNVDVDIAWRRLYACSEAQPLLWRATKNGRDIYLTASYHSASGEVTISPQVVNTLSCADVGYFELPCSVAPDGGMGHYFSHCSFYPTSVEQDSIASRLNSADITNLQRAIRNIVNMAAPECKQKADQLNSTVTMLNDTRFRMALFPYYFEAVKILDPQACGVSPSKLTHDDQMRSMIDANGRPAFGLEDVATQCAAIQGNTVEEDIHLARWISHTFNNETTAASVAVSKADHFDAVQCGDLSAMANSQPVFNALPWLTKRILADRNLGMIENIERALALHSNETIVVVVGALHFAHVGISLGIPSLLEHRGFAVERISESANLNCTSSTHRQSGAHELRQCLTPPFKSQPESCLKFAEQFAQKLGVDSLHGRMRDDSACKRVCTNSAGACHCDVIWANANGFEKLCAQPISGVTGQVFDTDLTRNPGSCHAETALSDRTIRSFTQECYATTCNIELLEEMALRNWYSQLADLAEGEVRLRPTTLPAIASSAIELPNQPDSLFLETIPWWGWLMTSIIVVAVFATAIALANHPNSKPRSARSLRASMSTPAMSASFSDGSSDGEAE